MSRNTLLKATALTSSVVLVAGFIYYRSTGSLPWGGGSSAQAAAPQSAAPAGSKAVMSSSKSMVVTQAPAQSPTTTPATAPRVLIYGSKSGAIVLPTPPATQPAPPSK